MIPYVQFTTQVFPSTVGQHVWGPWTQSGACSNQPGMRRGDDTFLCFDDPNLTAAGLVPVGLDEARSSVDGNFLSIVGFAADGSPGSVPFSEIRSGPQFTTLIGRGDVVSGVGQVERIVRPRLDLRARGWACSAAIDTGAPVFRQIPVVDGSAIQAPNGEFLEIGTLVEHGNGTTARWNSIAEVWSDGEGGWYAFGVTDEDNSRNSVIVRNDRVVVREGLVLDGQTLRECKGIAVAPGGELIMMWEVASAFPLIEAIFVGERLAFLRGAPLDIDGDGAVEPGSFIAGLVADVPGPLALSDSVDVDEDRVARVHAGFVDGNGGFVTAVLQRQLPMGDPVCAGIANSTGAAGALHATGTTYLGGDGLTLVAEQLPPASFGLFAVGRDVGSTPNLGGGAGTLCLGGAIGRLMGPGAALLQADANGRFTADVDPAALPQPSGPVAVQPGETWIFQGWYRDVDPTGQATSNLTEAISLSFR